MKPRRVLQMTITLAALSTLGACGGGDDDPKPTAENPQSPTSPAPPPPPASPTPPTPPTTPPTTPSDPPPPPEISLAPSYTALYATSDISAPYWPAWRHTGTAAVDGVGCAKNEDYHIHSLVSVYLNGQRLALPDSIGRGSGCNYEMHTHDGMGVIHIETDVPKTFTLGQFFALWSQPLTTASAAGLPGTPSYYVIENEKITRYTGDPAQIVLARHKEILIVTGTPPAQVPRYDWSGTGL